MDAQLSTI